MITSLEISEVRRQATETRIAELEAKRITAVEEALEATRAVVKTNSQFQANLQELGEKNTALAEAKATLAALDEKDAQISFLQQRITSLDQERQLLEKNLSEKIEALPLNLQKMLGENREKTVAQIGRMLLDYFQGSFPRRCVLLPPPRGTLSERLHQYTMLASCHFG